MKPKIKLQKTQKDLTVIVFIILKKLLPNSNKNNNSKDSSKEFKLNTQKINFQNFMSEDNYESAYPMSKTNKFKIGAASSLVEEEEDEIALIEKEMNRIEELNKTNSE